MLKVQKENNEVSLCGGKRVISSIVALCEGEPSHQEGGCTPGGEGHWALGLAGFLNADAFDVFVLVWATMSLPTQTTPVPMMNLLWVSQRGLFYRSYWPTC